MWLFIHVQKLIHVSKGGPGDLAMMPMFEFPLNMNLASYNPDSKVYGANMGPNWVLSAPGGPHVGPINLAIREC